ncbi:MAG: hypothetical protein OJF49_001496 [Ktedonobacterales bacterium]|nr:MAG: hypothetical protein OJF49_001496 [Ktedonobacterales bacterium]
MRDCALRSGVLFDHRMDYRVRLRHVHARSRGPRRCPPDVPG